MFIHIVRNFFLLFYLLFLLLQSSLSIFFSSQPKISFSSSFVSFRVQFCLDFSPFPSFPSFFFYPYPYFVAMLNVYR